MSRVTIKDLYWEVQQDEQDSKVCDNYNWCEYKDIEIVPRKMVEMIIDYCENLADLHYKNLKHAIDIQDKEGEKFFRQLEYAFRGVISYSSILLTQFEEDPK